MPYHVTQELEAALEITTGTNPTTTKTDAIRQANRELSALEDDPRIYNYDVLNATIDSYPDFDGGPYTVTVSFTITVNDYTQGMDSASEHGVNTILSAIEGFFDTRNTVGDAAIQPVI